MNNSVAVRVDNDILKSAFAITNKDIKSRINLFVKWLNESGFSWFEPKLSEYAAHLSKSGKVSPSSINTNLSTIRGQYDRILKSNEVRDMLYGMIDGDIVTRKAFVDETITRIYNSINPKLSSVKEITKQDKSDKTQRRLTLDQVKELIALPGTDTLHGLRNSAILTLMFCTGIREAELCALEVQDLRQYYNGDLSLEVRQGKGSKQRLIPYGSFVNCLDIVDMWLKKAYITSGPVFRSVGRRETWVGNTALTTKSIQNIVALYKIEIDGVNTAIRPHDCRRTYARLMHDNHMDKMAIQQNLGHSNDKTTQGYIGDLDAKQRSPKNITLFDATKTQGIE